MQTFKIQAADVGALSSVSVNLDAVGNLSSWRPKQIEVVNTVTDSYGLFKNSEELIYYWNGSAELTQVGMDQGGQAESQDPCIFHCHASLPYGPL